MSATAGSTDAATFPDEGSLAHVEPLELVDRLVGLEFSGRVVFFIGAVEGEVGIVEGQVVDARALGDFGEPALFRMLGASAGTYKVERRVSASAPPQAFAAWDELKRRFAAHREQLARLATSVGGLEKVWALRYQVLPRFLHDLPDRINPLLRRLDGRRSVAQVVTETPLGEPISIRALHKLLRLGLLVLPDEPDVEVPTSSPIKRSLEGGRVPEIGSDLPVKAQWFDDAHRPDEARDDERRRVLEGELPAAPEPEEEEVVPAQDPLRTLEPEVRDTLPEHAASEEPDDDEAAAASEDDDVSETADTVVPSPRPLPEPPDVMSFPPGTDPGVDLHTWSSQGEPPPDPVTRTTHPEWQAQADLDDWLREEEGFFATPAEEMAERAVEPPPEAVSSLPSTPPTEAPATLRFIAAAALIAVGAFLGAVLVRGCPGAPATTSENWSPPAVAATVDG